jgi:acyl-coenzyme A thioesterase PaaI-like protein
MDNRPDLVNIRGAIQGGLVATLIDIAAGRLAGNVAGPGQDVFDAGRDRLAARATLTFAVLERR